MFVFDHPYGVSYLDYGDFHSAEPTRTDPWHISIPSEQKYRITTSRGYHGTIQNKRERTVREEAVSIGGSERMSTALVRPGDIQDAVDANDLLSTLLENNLEIIESKKIARLRKDWVSEQRKKIKKGYFDKAEAAYQKMWNACSNSKLGHNYRNDDVSGRTIKVCDSCSFHFAKIGNFGEDRDSRQAESMNNDLIQILANRLIELDEEAGILVWPTEENAPKKYLDESPKAPGKKKRFRR